MKPGTVFGCDRWYDFLKAGCTSAIDIYVSFLVARNYSRNLVSISWTLLVAPQPTHSAGM